jgi:hypothetical protein
LRKSSAIAVDLIRELGDASIESLLRDRGR